MSTNEGTEQVKKQNVNINKKVLTCPDCDFSCTSKQNLRIHFQKTNHKPPELTKEPKLIPDHIRKSVSTLKDYVQITDREHVIGLEYILEYRLQVTPDKTETKYFCEICELDSELIPMLEHLCGPRHRKLYLTKDYPYVLKASSNINEDRTQFMKRMALEIEKEDKTKTYKTDPVIRTEPMMNKSPIKEAKPPKRKTKWYFEGDLQKRMKKSLDYLESFEIDTEYEASTVTRLAEKLTAELKFYSDKLKEEALFPAKVARAKDIATLITHKSGKAPQNTNQETHKYQGPKHFSAPIGFQPSNQNSYRTPTAACPQNPQIQTAKNPTDQTTEDIKFVKKLKALLGVFSQNTMQPDHSQINSKLMMLKSLLLNKTANVENTSANQLRMQMDSLTQRMAQTENVSLNQQWTIMSTTNTATMAQFSQNIVMNVGPTAQYAYPVGHAMNMAALLGNSQVNVNPFLPGNQFTQNHGYVQMDNNSLMLMNQTSFQHPHMGQQPGFTSTFQSNGNGGMANNYGNTHLGQYGNTAREDENISHSSISNTGVNQAYNDFRAEHLPYSRVCQGSENERLQDIDLRNDLRSSYGESSSRLLDDPAMVERRSGMHYDKHAMLGAAQEKNFSDESVFLPKDTTNLTADLLKSIKGKDLFTVSAILSEFAESHSK